MKGSGILMTVLYYQFSKQLSNTVWYIFISFPPLADDDWSLLRSKLRFWD